MCRRSLSDRNLLAKFPNDTTRRSGGRNPESGTKEFRFASTIMTPFPFESQLSDVPYRTYVGNVGDNEVPVSPTRPTRSERQVSARNTCDDRLRSIKLTDGARCIQLRVLATFRFSRAIFIRSTSQIDFVVRFSSLFA